MRLLALLLQEGFVKLRRRHRALRDLAVKRLLGRDLDPAVRVRLVERANDSVEEKLEVDEVNDLLALEALGEPQREGPVIGLDLSAHGSVARLGPDSVGAEVGEARAECVGVEDRGAVGVEPLGKTPAQRGLLEDAHGGSEVGAGHDQRGEDRATGVVEYGNDVDLGQLARGEPHGEGTLGVGLPDSVGLARDEAATSAALRAGLPDARVAGVSLEAALERRARDLDSLLAKLGAEHREQKSKRLRGVLLEVSQGGRDDLGREAAAWLALVLARLWAQASQAPSLVGAQPAVERREGNAARRARRPAHGRFGDAPENFASLAVGEVSGQSLLDQLVAPEGDRFRVGWALAHEAGSLARDPAAGRRKRTCRPGRPGTEGPLAGTVRRQGGPLGAVRRAKRPARAGRVACSPARRVGAELPLERLRSERVELSEAWLAWPPGRGVAEARRGPARERRALGTTPAAAAG